MSDLSDLDVGVLAKELALATSDRILPVVHNDTVGDTLRSLSLVVAAHRPDDQKERQARRYITDWVKTQNTKLKAEVGLSALQGMSWENDDGTRTPVVATLDVLIWPRPPLSEMDEYFAKIRAQKKAQSAKGGGVIQDETG